MEPEPATSWQLVRAIQDLAHEALESDTRIHERIDTFNARLQALWSYARILERRIATLEGQPQNTDLPSSFLHELD